ncbi:hypothetical protein O1611_g10649 [Lasiodiplodia mahajangana]|uniref:Uncharacterized protein n=1 Tax=Lasiodiplodia mahajangana TaxID=1108764 RepID=A0ACC2IVZ0_9PEZI|nr:hypothetical protein O1611_g10649 [Lasiodiplodia mahajangana]
MARPNSSHTLRPQKVSTPPMTQRKRETPTEPVAWKMLDGVENTNSCVSTRAGQFEATTRWHEDGLTPSSDHLIQDEERSTSDTDLSRLIVIVFLDVGDGFHIGILCRDAGLRLFDDIAITPHLVVAHGPVRRHP